METTVTSHTTPTPKPIVSQNPLVTKLLSDCRIVLHDLFRAILGLPSDRRAAKPEKVT
ncbi:MAG: hypothetical protein HYV95_03155 [Opitutae bacterium]|nr:hypothetical protein [Opitutae bacterium]